MKKTILLVTLFAIALQAQAQIFSKSIKGNGNKITQHRSISDFSKISVFGSFEVILTKSNSRELTITADENVMEYIVTKIKNDRLRIKVENGYTLKNTSVKIEVPFKELEKLNLAGSGIIFSTSTISDEEIDISLAGSGTIDLQIDTDEVDCNIAGSGTVKLQGTTNELEVKIAGSGSCESYDLVAEKVKVRVAGSGDAKVFVKKELNAKTIGSGDVFYKGNPEIIKTNSLGSGDIIKK